MLLRRDDGYEICDDDARLDVDLLHRWLSEDAYWALGRSRDTVARCIANSVNLGLYRLDADLPDANLPGANRPDAGQVGFARLVTDRATFAWLCDVYVDRSERGKGLGTWLVSAACDLVRDWRLGRVVLSTLDAHAVYARFGFTPMVEPDRWMELRLR